MKKFLKNIDRRIVEFSLLVFLPILLVFVISSIIMSQQQLITEKNRIDDALELFANESETDIQNTINRICDLSSNETIQSVLTFKDYNNDQIISDINISRTIFNNMVSTSNLLDSVAIYNKKANTVISNAGKYDADIYFNKFYSYSDFDYDYWLSFREPLSTITILPPSRCTTADSDKSFIPIVFSSIGSIQSTSIIIANIDIEQIIDSAYNFKLPENSVVFLKNQNEKTIHPKVKYLNEQNVFEFLQSISNKHTSTSKETYNFKDNGKKYYISSITPRKSVLGYYYIVAIPYKEIYHYLNNNSLWFIFLLISIIIVYILIIFVIYKKLTPAFRSLTTYPHSSESTTRKGLLEHINERVSGLSEQNIHLRRSMDELLPIHQQKIITKILNSTNYTDDYKKEFEEVVFKYDSFISITVKIYFNINNSLDRNTTKADIMTLLEMYLKEYYEIIPLPSSEDTWYAILNLDSSSVTTEDVVRHISNLIESLKFDMTDFDIIYGIGNIHPGLEGLLQTHNEAIDDLLKNKQEQKVIIPSSKIVSKLNTLIIDDTKLTNYLIAGHYEKAKTLIGEFTSQISQDNPQPYISILTTILNILYINNIDSGSSLPTTELISSVLSKPKAEIDEYIGKLIDILEENIQPSVSKVDIGEVIAYIAEHYSEDIYLDSLAEKFNTNAKYLSRRIKQHINIGFKDYLLKLRIDNAKRLLTETDMSINSIAEIVGIPRRNTFIGVFKKIVGTTPSEYRASHK